MIYEKKCTPDWDQPGALSIVVQGGLFQDNLLQTAIYCGHWRDLFPRAEIILSVSVTDVLEADLGASVAVPLRLTQSFQGDGQLRAALAMVERCCDRVVVSPGAVTLPALKLDGRGANNVNLQIAAARSGLAAATGTYVLRTRSDLVFMDRRFLDQYNEGERLPRGPMALFRRRVMASWLYTLNPYTVERMAFHLSDWFHLGLTEDVRRIWDVPFMTYADAVHHRFYRHSSAANREERMIVPRRAVEQHVIYHCLKQYVPDLKLACNEDWSSREDWVDILADNFNLCDVGAVGCMFDKYSFDFNALARRIHCVTREDWRAMVLTTGEDRRRILTDKLLDAPESVPFPRRWSAEQLRTKQGFRSGGEILAGGHGGVLVHGPYAVLPTGRYLATLNTSMCCGPGIVTLRATLGEGARVLAERKITLEARQNGKLELPFALLSGTGVDFELVCEVEGDPEIVVDGLTVAERRGLDLFAQLFAGGRMGSPDESYRLLLTETTLRIEGSGRDRPEVTVARFEADDPAAQLVMQGDGNLVVYSVTGLPLWASGTQGSGASEVVMTDGGAFELRDGSAVVWRVSAREPGAHPAEEPQEAQR